MITSCDLGRSTGLPYIPQWQRVKVMFILGSGTIREHRGLYDHGPRSEQVGPLACASSEKSLGRK